MLMAVLRANRIAALFVVTGFAAIVRYDIERSIVRSGDERGSENRAKRFLGANERVVVDHPVLDPILREIRANSRGADRELFYGTHPADRVKFTTGRDLRLGPEHEGRPLNYFSYPYIEVLGERSDSRVRARFRCREFAGS